MNGNASAHAGKSARARHQAHIVHDWRDDSHYRALARLDCSSIRWEWLRRHQDYQQASTVAGAPAISVRKDGSRIVEPQPSFDPHPWGLHFRNSLDRVSARYATLLAGVA